MSDIPTDYRERLDIETILTQLARSREETLKFTAEQHKLMAEAAKLNRDRWLAPWLVLASVMSGVIVAVISHLWR